MVPGEDGPEIARASNGAPLDIFDVADFLSARYPRLYVVDLDGIEDNRPQLDFLQEIAREADVWIDAGPRTADQAIDILITGGRRAVLSTAYLRSEDELRKAWALSPDLAVEVEVRDSGVVAAEPAWTGRPVPEIAAAVRAVGVEQVVVSYRERDTDWSSVRSVADGGPTWVGGTFERSQASALGPTGAAGAIFHVRDELEGLSSNAPGSEAPSPGR